MLLEQEDVLASHTTGRSAAGFSVRGPGTIRPLTMASSTFLKNPPSDLVDGPLLSDMGVVTVAQPEHPEALREAIEASPDREILDAGQTLDLCPVLLPDKVLGATWAPDAMAIDVAALHQAYVRGLRRNGGVIKIGVRVTDLRRIGTDWEIRTRSERQRCRVVVNAAGAWGDNVASMAGAPTGRALTVEAYGVHRHGSARSESMANGYRCKPPLLFQTGRHADPVLTRR